MASTSASTQALNSSCCLCRVPFDSTGLKKRKLLYNDGCSKARNFLNEVLHNKMQLSLNSFLETSVASNPHRYLCNKCDQAKAYFMHKEELQKIEQEVVATVSRLTRLATTSMATTGNNAAISRQRTQSSRLSSRNKRRRLMPASTQVQSPLIQASVPPPSNSVPSALVQASVPPPSNSVPSTLAQASMPPPSNTVPSVLVQASMPPPLNSVPSTLAQCHCLQLQSLQHHLPQLKLT